MIVYLDRYSVLHTLRESAQLRSTTTSGINTRVCFREGVSNSPEMKYDLLKAPWNLPSEELPAVVLPKGLTAERQWYLHKHICPFCAHEVKDTVCPLPIPGSRLGTPTPDNDSDGAPPPPIRPQLCCTCKQGGHDKQSYPLR